MTSGAERTEHRNPEPKSWIEQNNDLFVPHAENIINLLKENQICVVVGRYGVGKTYSLCPALEEKLAEQGWTYEFDDFTNHLPKTLFPRFIKPPKEAVILDEAGETLLSYSNEALKMTKRLHGNGIKMINLFGYHPEKKDLLEQRIELWKRISFQTTKKEPAVYELPEKILTPEVANIFLKGENKNISQDALNFIVNYIPMNWRIISDLGNHSNTLAQLKNHIKEYMDSWLRTGVMSRKEFEALKFNIL